jgi:hypothetical protein
MKHLKVDAAKLAALADRWSDRSPEEGTEECICMLCAKMIGADERDPRWRDHDEDCAGCELCEIAVRMWNENDKCKEMRFHPKCFVELLALRSGTC